MKCKLTRLSSNHQNLRTDEVIGECSEEPTLGELFQMTAAPLEGGNLRWICTTPVKEITPVEGGFAFKTRNSHYRFEKIADDIPTVDPQEQNQTA